MTSDVEAELFVVVSGGHARHLVQLIYLGEDLMIEDSFLTNAHRKIVWAETPADAARLAESAGHPTEPDIWDLADDAFVLDGLIEAISSPLARSTVDRLLAAWDLFDGVASSVGESFVADVDLYERLFQESGFDGDGSLIRTVIKRSWRRSQPWADDDLDALRRTARAGLELLSRHIMSTPSA